MITPSFGLTATERVLPKLALDFTTANLDSRVTFTRTTDASHPATYINSSGVITAATNNQPRFDYDPVALTCKGLLIEESRTNTLTYSEELASSWTPTRITINPDQTTAPDGNNTADALTADVSTSTSHYMTNTQSFTSGTTYSWSVFAKILGTAGYRLRLRYQSTSFGATLTADFNLSAGTVAAQSGGVSASIQAFPDGWYRCTFTATATASVSDQLWLMLVTSSGGQNFIGDGTSGAYVWGAQIEAGAFATSYIPTTSAALTRNADVATMTGTNFSDWYNASEGTVVANFVLNGFNPANQDRVLSITDGVNAEIDIRQTTSSALSFNVSGGASGSAAISVATSISAGTPYTVAGAYKNNDIAAAANAGTVGTDGSCSVPVVNQMKIGVNSSGSSTTVFNGTIGSILYYKQRLTNNEIRAFSK